MSFALLFFLTIATFIALVLKKYKAGICLVSSSILWTFFVGCGILPNILLKNLQTQIPPSLNQWKSKNVVILLGGGLVRWNADGHASPSLFGYSRIYEAGLLYLNCKKNSDNCRVLISGGDPLKMGKSEAEIMSQELIEVGVSESDIILESKSNNTYQNAEFSSKLLQSPKEDGLILVTSGVHIRRALLYFSQFGISATPAPSDQINAQWSWLPSSYNFFLTDLSLHEYVGIFRFHLYNSLGWNRTHSTNPGAP